MRFVGNMKLILKNACGSSKMGREELRSASAECHRDDGVDGTLELSQNSEHRGKNHVATNSVACSSSPRNACRSTYGQNNDLRMTEQ